MKILADMHISPLSVDFLKSLGHDASPVNDILPANATDRAIVEMAKTETRTILTQDLDFSEIISLSGESAPSLISLQ